MPSKPYDETSLNLPDDPLTMRISDVVEAPSAGLTRRSRMPSDEEREIYDNLMIDLAIQRGTVIKAEHGAYLAHVLTKRSVSRFADYVTFDREIMDREWSNPVDQEQVRQFTMQTRRSYAAGDFAMRQSAVTTLGERVSTPLDPTEDKGDSVIIEQHPGILGALFGGSKVTTVKR